MRTLILGFLIFLCWMFVSRWYYVCKIRNQCGYETELVEDVRAKTLNLVDNGKNILTGRDQFKFEPKSINPTLNSDNKKFIADVAQFLADNPKKKLTITGNYLPSEIDPAASYGFFENLGLARADAIRKMLVKAGIPENRMKLDHNLLDEGATLDYPISFNSFGDGKVAEGNNKDDNGKDAEETPEEFDNSGQEFSFTNMSFSDANFAYDSDVFKPGPAFIAYADSVKTFLAEDTDKSLLLTGHTCNKGSDSYNQQLGKDRAVSVKKYFTKLGVKAKIGTASDGESNPAYSNDTEKSRAKNRRVVVQIK